MINIEEELETFPFTPNSVTESMHYQFIAEQFTIDNRQKTVNDLIFLLYEYPERTCYLFLESHHTDNKEVLQCLDEVGILHNKWDNFYYKHPNFKNDFIQIRKNTKWDWEKEIFDTQPMYVRFTLSLSNKLEKEIDRLNLIQAIEDTKDIIILQPNAGGIGIDVRALWNKLKKVKLNRLF